jgi:hypothetical protein
MKYLTHLLCFLIGCLLTYCGTEHFKPIPEVREIEKEVIKEKITTKEVEVLKLKESKSKIVYRTLFDTMATMDTIYVELIKCDSVVKIDSVIIQEQDTIIIDQKELIQAVETDNTVLKSDLKKQRRKNFLTKVVAGLAIVVTILVSR